LALIESAASHGITRTTYAAAIRWHGIHRIVSEAVRVVGPLNCRRQGAITEDTIRLAPARQIEGHRLSRLRRPGIGRLPLIQAHSVVADLGHLFDNAAFLAFEKTVEPGVSQLVIIEPRISHATLTDYRVLRRAFVGAMQRWGNDCVLLISDLRLCRLAHIVISGKIRPDGHVVPRH